MLKLYLNIRNCLNSEEGQDLAEYGLLLGFIAVMVMVAVMALGVNLLYYFDTVASAVMVWSVASIG